MNKGEFIDRLADTTDLTKKEARTLLDSVLNLIQDTLLRGESVGDQQLLHKFGG